MRGNYFEKSIQLVEEEEPANEEAVTDLNRRPRRTAKAPTKYKNYQKWD